MLLGSGNTVLSKVAKIYFWTHMVNNIDVSVYLIHNIRAIREDIKYNE